MNKKIFLILSSIFLITSASFSLGFRKYNADNIKTNTSNFGVNISTNAYSVQLALEEINNFIFTSTDTFCLWEINIDSSIYYNNGNVGISTTNPQGLFQIGNGTFTVLNNGNIGIGTINPSEKLELREGNFKIKNTSTDDSISMTDAFDNKNIYFHTISDSHIKNNLIIGSSTTYSITNLDVRGKLRYSDAQFIDEMWNDLSPEWSFDIETGSGSVQSKNNGWYRLQTGTTTTNEQSIDWNDICTFKNLKNPIFECNLQIEEINNTEIEIGLKESETIGSDDYIIIGFDPSAQNTWYLKVSSAASSSIDQGIIATTNETLLRFNVYDETSVKWYINNILQGIISTNIPIVLLQPFIRIKTEEDIAHYIDIDFVKLWQER